LKLSTNLSAIAVCVGVTDRSGGGEVLSVVAGEIGAAQEATGAAAR